MLNAIRKVVRRLLPKKDIQQAMHVDVAISTEMAEAIDYWNKIYLNKAPWLNAEEGVFSLEIGSAIASEFARQATIEMKSKIDGNDYLNEQYQYVIDDLRECIEYMCALGGLVFKPYISGDDIIVDYVQADQFFPVAYDNRKRITAAIFPERKVDGKKVYTRLEYHRYENGNHIIESHAFLKTNGEVNTNLSSDIGREIELSSVPEWADIEPYFVVENVKRPLFVYVRTPGANNIDKGSPLGMSIYKKAINLIKEADKQYGRYLWEFEGGELALDVSEELFELGPDNKPSLPKNKKKLYRSYNSDDKINLYEQFAPQLRDESFARGFNDLLKRIEFNVGLSYGTLSDPQNVDKTATEIRTSKQRMYSTVTDIQKVVSKALDDLAYVLSVYANGKGIASDINIKPVHEWDDSILIDVQAEKMMDMQEVNAGLMPKWRYAMKWQGMTEEQAKAEYSEIKGITFPNDEVLVDEGDIRENAENAVGKALNGAQTQSLLTIIQQYATGSISIGQAINVLSTAIGIPKEDAKKIIEGNM